MACGEHHIDFYTSKTCKRCKRLIRTSSIYGYCENCEEIMHEAYIKIKNYLQDFPAATTMEIQNELGISVKIIHHLIAEGRVSFHSK
ncbi:hypothetical protein [Thermotalea metallivorans]|uniref:Uncharacterized protein n=1 Tax=Thermotalea metallivorans TaxID=520762 RepID=A0A140LDK7_9FIRM|nr:hypothetical protein [Thermotalea metallivorans]KXG78632.1 hypothetical protein AN619_01580 [Thermotalea metallivorans]